MCNEDDGTPTTEHGLQRTSLHCGFVLLSIQFCPVVFIGKQLCKQYLFSASCVNMEETHKTVETSQTWVIHYFSNSQ